MSAYSHSGHVYFALVGPYVKIGYSSQKVGLRLHGMLTPKCRLICPEDLDRGTQPRLLHVVPNCVQRDEARLHGLFASHHVVGEWYRLDAAFLDRLDRMQYVTYKEMLANLRLYRRELKKAQSRLATAKAAA